MLWGGSGNRVVVGAFGGGVLDSLPRRGVVGWRFRRDADGGRVGIKQGGNEQDFESGDCSLLDW